MVSVSGLSPAQLQAATQRLIVSSTPGQPKTIVGTTAVQGKLSQAQLQMMRQVTLKQQQLRLQAAGGLAAQAVKTATVTIAGGQTAVQVQFTQAQPRAQVIFLQLFNFCKYLQRFVFGTCLANFYQTASIAFFNILRFSN